MPAPTAAAVRARARALGFDHCGIAPAADQPELPFLREWLDRGYAGEMHYLHRSAERRIDVRQVLPSARSVIVLGTLYNVERPYSTESLDPARAGIARYAWGDDYHAVIGRRLERLVDWLREEAGDTLEARPYVDTGPVQERVYAKHAGLGWIGKNTCLINPQQGSWFFLAEVITNLDLAADAPATDQCGSCTLCLDACPTGAIVAPHVLDSTLCLSYLTIELKTAVPEPMRDAVESHAYGCDVCQEVCPWNWRAAEAADPAWMPRAGLDGVRLVDLWRRTDDELRILLKGSAMKRAGVRRFRRNLAIALGNSGDPEAAAALAGHDEPTCRDPLVAEHIDWALRKLGVERPDATLR
jgi:epoxyqueuosine reductase